MADVRALLRQQRAARRIDHPHAAYSDAGKLLCTVCHEHVKAESLWDGHARSPGHRQRLQGLSQQLGAAASITETAAPAPSSDNGTSHKRKLDEDEDDDMEDETAHEEAVRRKRSRPEMTLGDESSTHKPNFHNGKPLTPPATRRQSSTPTLGVELQMPSRPATPVAVRGDGSGSSNGSAGGTPGAAPVGRSPLIPHDASASTSQPKAAPRSQPTDTTTPATISQAQQPPIAATAAKSTATIDEDEWAAFEADLVHGTSHIQTDAVISAPAMTVAELAAKSEEEETAKRRAATDIEMEDEREDAAQALESEFEVMEELEARARKLRERREALRVLHRAGGDLVSSSSSSSSTHGKGSTGVALGKENLAAGAQGDEEEEEDDDEEEVDDWVGFRFRA
ncbi:hypothetical protein B0T22DRAFT_35705 [Podospora appendiculata]|uniref:Coiled-coil domain-containing protein 16 n=1 Tax=Podospora appendiculata TaxID=314037 RepID=A0AAE0XH67_9PEZI|nr:hypothetical protein B0T22DRAFT_35705 [Podospora appendiculata]